nr:AMP-binding protein [Halorussus sp. MSC15.2]
MFSHHERPYDWVGAWSERRASLSPDSVGVVDATTGERFTYAELDRRANRVARLLREEGVAEGERVAVLSRNRPELVDLFFATAKTGGVLAPLSHRLAAGELVEMLNDVDPALLVVEAPFAALAADVLAHDARKFDCSVVALSPRTPTRTPSETTSAGRRGPTRSPRTTRRSRPPTCRWTTRTCSSTPAVRPASRRRRS